MSPPHPLGGSCAQVGCPAAETGECLDGLLPNECPNFQRPVVADGEAQDVAPAEGEVASPKGPGAEPVPATTSAQRPTKRSGWVDLPTGDALTQSQVASIRAASLPRLVVMAGPTEAGKTTIITSIYEALLFGDLEGHLFCASSTLPGLEQRCFLNRPESGLDRPETEHTQPSAEPRFLHLRTSTEQHPSQHTDVLFGDISGEDFEDIRNNRGVIERMPYLSLADHLAIFVDGEALCTRGVRESADMDASQLVERFVDSSFVPSDCRVHIVVSKMDLVEHVGGPTTIAYARSLSKRLRDSAAKRFHCVEEHFVAARPTGKPPQSGRQLNSLYSSWSNYSRPLPATEEEG